MKIELIDILKAGIADERSWISNNRQTATLTPTGKPFRLAGTPGQKYRLVIINHSDELAATTCIDNMNKKGAVRGYTVDIGQLKEVAFTMPDCGYLVIYNTTKNSFLTQPVITFSIRAVKK
ncbi:MAG: hypothetical protein N4A72_13635 [Bacteroidales bacterium]|jgi:hypothetical protein|nr:hypothetical protein [Bacteroidales bacterium]